MIRSIDSALDKPVARTRSGFRRHGRLVLTPVATHIVPTCSRPRFIATSMGNALAENSLVYAGVLLMPALPLILYAIVAKVSLEEMFLGGLLPTAPMVFIVAAWGVSREQRGAPDEERPKFDWRQVGAAWMFLLVLNLMRLAAGCVMDIYTAIVVFVLAVVRLAQAFGAYLVHPDIVFLANPEPGYRTPPVGRNLLFASYRFDKPIAEEFHAVVALLVALCLGVVAITYVR